MRQAIISGYARAATVLGLCDQGSDPRHAAGLFMCWLESTGRRWLIVLDNLDTPAHAAGWWPPVSRYGRTVVTTRRRDAVLSTDRRRLVEVDGRLQALVRSLPEVQPTGSAQADNYPDTAGALLLRLLRNRNIRPYNAQILMAVGDGLYVSRPTMAALGSGRVVITPQYVTAFAYLLGYPPADIVAVTGVGAGRQGRAGAPSEPGTRHAGLARPPAEQRAVERRHEGGSSHPPGLSLRGRTEHRPDRGKSGCQD